MFEHLADVGWELPLVFGHEDDQGGVEDRGEQHQR